MIRVCLKSRSSMNSEMVRSDTLFGAICWGYRNLFGEDELITLLEKFDSGTPPFILSSCFPWLTDGEKRVYFFPKPLAEDKFMDMTRDEVAAYSKIKKLKYVPEEIFRLLIEGKIGDIKAKRTKIKRGQKWVFDIHGGRYIIENDIAIPEGAVNEKRIGRLHKVKEVPRNSINRLTMATDDNLFFREEMFFNENAGFFFLIKGSNGELSKIKAAVRYVEDRGIGGEISVGKGHIEIIDFEDFEGFKEEGSNFVTLSLYCPQKDELSDFNGSNVWYEPVVRKGKIENAFVRGVKPWKDKVLMFAEGSTFPSTGRAYYGCCPIVKKTPHHVRQYGYAFPVQMKVI